MYILHEIYVKHSILINDYNGLNVRNTIRPQLTYVLLVFDKGFVELRNNSAGERVVRSVSHADFVAVDKAVLDQLGFRPERVDLHLLFYRFLVEQVNLAYARREIEQQDRYQQFEQRQEPVSLAHDQVLPHQHLPFLHQVRHRAHLVFFLFCQLVATLET